MPRKRSPENTGLPSRWRRVHGAYYFQVPSGLEYLWDNKKLFRLGKSLPEAYKEWSDRLVNMDKIKNIGELLDRYSLEVIPTKAPKTQNENYKYIKNLRAVFGHMPISAIEPQDIYRYVDIRKQKVNGQGGLVIARKEASLFSHVYTKAVQWGYLKRHPLKGQVRLEGERPRTRYVEDWEVVECLGIASPVIYAYIVLKLLTGLRQGDLLRLKVSDIKEDGIHVTPNKTKKTTQKSIVYEWSDELKKAVDMAIKARAIDISPYVFCNRLGEGYLDEGKGTASGWASLWQRFMKRVLAETNVTERFTEHDLRAKSASDAKNVEHAMRLLSHSDSKITERVYRRKPEVIRPLR